MNQLIFQILIFLWLALAVIISLFIVLKREKEDSAYAMIFMWLFSPFLLIAGLLFVKPNRKKLYFQKLKTILFLN